MPCRLDVRRVTTAPAGNGTARTNDSAMRFSREIVPFSVLVVADGFLAVLRPKAHQVLMSMVSETNRTAASAVAKLTPPGCRLEAVVAVPL